MVAGNLEPFYNLQTAEQVGEHLSDILGGLGLFWASWVVSASFGHLGYSQPLLGISGGLGLFQVTQVVLASFGQLKWSQCLSGSSACLKVPLSSPYCLGRESLAAQQGKTPSFCLFLCLEYNGWDCVV